MAKEKQITDVFEYLLKSYASKTVGIDLVSAFLEFEVDGEDKEALQIVFDSLSNQKGENETKNLYNKPSNIGREGADINPNIAKEYIQEYLALKIIVAEEGNIDHAKLVEYLEAGNKAVEIMNFPEAFPFVEMHIHMPQEELEEKVAAHEDLLNALIRNHLGCGMSKKDDLNTAILKDAFNAAIENHPHLFDKIMAVLKLDEKQPVQEELEEKVPAQEDLSLNELITNYLGYGISKEDTFNVAIENHPERLDEIMALLKLDENQPAQEELEEKVAAQEDISLNEVIANYLDNGFSKQVACNMAMDRFPDHFEEIMGILNIDENQHVADLD